MPDGSLQHVPLSLVVPGDNDRCFDKQFRDERHESADAALLELAESIQENGLAQPPTLRPVSRWDGVGNCRLCGKSPSSRCRCKADTIFEVIAGERRCRALKLLGWEQVPAIVRQLTDEQASAIMLTENTSRADLNPMEEARAFQKRIDQFGWKIGRVAKTAGVSETTVKKRLKLLALIPDVQDLVASGNMPVGLAEEMSCLDANHQLIAFRWLNNQTATPTRRTFAGVVGGLYAEQCQESLFDLSRFELKTVIEDRLERGDGHLRSLLPAVDGLPDLPERNGTVARVIDRYAVALLETGHHDAAAVVLDLWKKMQESNYLTLPPIESEYVKWLSRH